MASRGTWSKWAAPWAVMEGRQVVGRPPLPLPSSFPPPPAPPHFCVKPDTPLHDARQLRNQHLQGGRIGQPAGGRGQGGWVGGSVRQVQHGMEWSGVGWGCAGA